MQIARWKVVRGRSEYAFIALGVIMNFAAQKGIALEFYDMHSPEADELRKKAGVNDNARHPLVFIEENDGAMPLVSKGEATMEKRGEAVPLFLQQPSTEQLQDLLDKFGKSNPTWGGKHANEHRNGYRDPLDSSNPCC